MSPARVFETAEQNKELQTLVSALDALLVTAYQLSLREQDLRRKVRLAHDEYQKLADRVEGGFQQGEQQVLDKIRPDDHQIWPKLDPSLKPLEVVDHLRNAGHIQPQLLHVVVAGVNHSRPGAMTPNGTNSEVRSNPCIVAEKARRSSLYERDFTTTGVRGSLRCPFAKPVDNDKSANGTQDGLSTANKCEFDPIKAELAPDLASSGGVSGRSSAAARCPIRYMDDHSPEELAKYFENHKHEIPRSHAVCVTRFQKNGETMRQIDAKYGSLVNMIQGLGEKHKALLPNAGRNGSSSSPDERVEKWAEDVSSKSPHPATLSTVEEDIAEESPADRTGRFERPLREIRVGESPSRPWGIPVPVSHQPPLSAMNSPVAPVQTSISKDVTSTPNLADSDRPSALQSQDVSPTPARPRGKCPFDHKALMQSSPSSKEIPAAGNDSGPHAGASSAHRDTASKKQQKSSEGTNTPTAKPSQMIFNGPVFFGYSAEEAAALMQQLGTQGAAE